MGDSVIRTSSSAHPPSLPFLFFLVYFFNLTPIGSAASFTCQSKALAPPHPLTNPSPPTASQKDPLSAGGQVSILRSPLLSPPLFTSCLLNAKDSSLLFLFFFFPPTKGDEVMERRGNETVLRCVPKQLSAEFQPRTSLPSVVSQLAP